MLAPAAAELWHQQVLPGMAPSSRWGSAYAHAFLALSIPRAGLDGQDLGPNSQNPGARAVSPLPCWPCLSPGLPLPCLSLTISNMVTILRPFTAAADSVEGYTCRRCLALPFICGETSLPLFADGNGPGPKGAPWLTGRSLWGETLKTII